MVTTHLREAPHSDHAEQSVLGALLLDNDAIDRIDGLRADHFYRADHRMIFANIVAMLEQSRPADVITLFEALTSSGKCDDAGGLVYLNQLAQNVPSAANIRRYAEIVRDRALKRSVITIADELSDSAFSGEGSARELLNAAGTKLEQLAEARSGSVPTRVSDDMSQHLETIDARTQGLTKAIPTGFEAIDRRLSGGIRRGQLVVVGARPGMGKTALALGMARHASVDHSVLMLSMEMPRSELHDRNIAAVGRIDLSSLLSVHGVQQGQWKAIMRAAEQIAELNLYIDDQGALRLLDVRLKARMVRRRHGLDLLVIDYLGLMEGHGENRYAQIDTITRGLKALAKELDIGIVLLAQLNRELEKRTDKRPQLSDLRDSGSIEQDADVVLLLYRDQAYHPDTADRGICEVHVAKNRQGATGHELLEFIDTQVRFEPHAGRWTPLRARTRVRQFEDA